MTDEEIAGGCASLLYNAAALQRRDYLSHIEPIREKVKEMRIDYGDPGMRITTMTGMALNEFVDFQHQFLVEQTGFRATLAKRRFPL